MRRPAAILISLVAVSGWLLASPLLPNKPDSLKFAVIGDNGTGGRPQIEVADQMVARRQLFRFELVLMVGDNFYGRQKPADLVDKFDRPYKALLDAGVIFQAALGNHDEMWTIDYTPLNMRGQRYYTYARQNVRFLVLDTNELDPAQLRWAEATLEQAREGWRIAYFHHPLYSNAGRHGSNVDLRVLLEPLLVKYGVQVVFSGHDHVYERVKPQHGIHYFVTGSSGNLRKGDLHRTDMTAAGFDQDCAFLLAEISGDDLYFETVSRTGVTVDSGHFRRISAGTETASVRTSWRP